MSKMRQAFLKHNISSYLFSSEIPQTNNINANSQLWIQPDGSLLKLYVVNGEMTQKNIQVISRIHKMPHLRLIKELTFPLKIVYSSGDMVGFTMPFCNGITLEEAITSENISPYCILSAFKKLATVINRLPNSIQIGDLHGRNVLVEETGEIHIIDLDGFTFHPYVMTCPLSALQDFTMIQGLSKYWDNANLIVSKDTDILCFFFLFLRWLMNSSSLEVYAPKEIYRYLNYLKAIGFPVEIIDMLYLLFEEEHNILLPNLFDKIDLSKLESYRYTQFLEVPSRNHYTDVRDIDSRLSR